jgi:two-component system, OmpR family, phosphate regulon sensor histidine kinase PhoR
MNIMLIRIVGSLILQQLILLGSIVFLSDSRALIMAISVVSGLALAGICYAALRPFKSLGHRLRASIDPVTMSAGAGDFCKHIDQHLSHLEEQLERQTVQLAEYKERFDAVLSGMIEGVIAIDQAGRVQFLNRAARNILSIDMPDFLGKPLVGLVRYEAVQKATRQAWETNRIVNTTFQTYERDRRDVRLRVAPMAGDPLPGMTLVFHDITELTRLETIRRDFVANVSHELKTPLSSIKANAETLLMGALHKSPDNMRFLQQIDQQAETLNQQIHDLLQLARIESGRQAFSLEPVDLVLEGSESIERHREEAQKKQVHVRVDSQLDESDSCLIWADRDAIRTMLDNLVSNALRYSHHHGTGRREAKVRLAVRLAGNEAVVEVIDNGIGIAPEHQSRIFERFFRVDPARSRELGGTGLGLAIVKHLAQSFEGRVELSSKLGVGSTFRLAFPRFIQPSELVDQR